ncbi:MAG: AAA family ATPase [Planctomycetota bacterium]
MDTHDSTIDALRAALSVSPENVPLRKHLADTLARLGRHQEAETEYREALARAPGADELKVGLAQCFFAQGKDSHAMVIVEEMVRQDDTPAAAYLLHARLLLRAGDIAFAVSEYKQAVRADASLRDPALEEMLGIDQSDVESEVVDGRIRAGWEGDEAAGAPMIPIERPKISFSDVGGMDALKEEIRMKIIYPIEHAEMFRAYGKPIGGGILMYGPPGCGKTHLARATAGEIKARFIAVGINDILDMWIGNSERNLHELFEVARRSRPCVMFFDEVDALGAARSDMRSSAGRHLINQFLSELDGVPHSNDGVLVLAATNAPWHMDAAFRRPGRFDRVLFVPPPDEAARAAILRILLAGKPCAEVEHTAVARKAHDFSGADMKSVVDHAVEAKLAKAMKTGKPEPIGTSDLLGAVKKVRASTKDWFATARNYAMYSNQGGQYDDVLAYLKLQ